MKKLILFAVAILFIAFSGFAQFVEIKFSDLDKTSQKMFSKYGTINPYGTLLNFDGLDSTSILGVFKITEIPKSRMATDTTQYMIVYNKNKGCVKGCVVTISDPTVNGEGAASIAAFMNNTGLKQGDDEFTKVEGDDEFTKVEDDYDIEDKW